MLYGIIREQKNQPRKSLERIHQLGLELHQDELAAPSLLPLALRDGESAASMAFAPFVLVHVKTHARTRARRSWMP